MATPAPKLRPPPPPLRMPRPDREPPPPPPPLPRRTIDDARASLTNPNWRWRSYGVAEENIRYPLVDNRIEAARKGPFEVLTHRRIRTPWPEVLHIALFSRPLVQILEQYLPSIRELRSVAPPIVAGRELYLVLDSLKQHSSHVGGDSQVQPAAAGQNVDGAVKRSEEDGKNEESPESQNLTIEERNPEHTEAEDGSFQPATANQIADAAVPSTDVVRSNEDSPKSHDSSVKEAVPKHTEVQGGDFEAAIVPQSADAAASKSEVIHNKEDSPESQKLSAGEAAAKHTEEQSGDFQPAAADQSAGGAVTSSDVIRSIEDSPESKKLSGKDGSPKYMKAKTVIDEEFRDDASIGTEKLGTKDTRPSKGNASNLVRRTKGEVPRDEASLTDSSTDSDEDEQRSEPEAPVVLTDVEVGLRHLKHLVRCLEEEYGDVPEAVRRMREKKRVTWDMLWAFLPRGTNAVYYCDTSEEMRYASVSESYYESMRDEYLLVKLDVRDYDGQRYRSFPTARLIFKYSGEKSFSDLAVCPDEIMGTPKLSKEEFLTRGKMFHELVNSTRRFMHYTGNIFFKYSGKPPPPPSVANKSKADGRVMIDFASFAERNPGCPTGYARPQTSGVLSSEKGFCNDVSRAVSDYCLMASPAIVYGFSFALKRWGAFSVTGFKEITFNKSAFEDLILAQDKKTLIYNLVSQHVSKPDDASALGSPELAPEQVDPITQKGEGCVFLCYGLPGSGKSLTAESIAENLERPLWDVRVNDLRFRGPTLEGDLMQIVELAARWQAILHVSEADVFLQNRNAASGKQWVLDMIATFLRVLDHNQGVMFLTTNRTGAIDEAFRDRISVFLRYNDVGAEDKQKLWRTLLTKGAVEGVTDELCGELATRDFSGREIKNTIRSARFWAKSIGEPVAAKHVKYMTELRSNSLKSLDADLGTPALELNEFVHL